MEEGKDSWAVWEEQWDQPEFSTEQYGDLMGNLPSSQLLALSPSLGLFSLVQLQKAKFVLYNTSIKVSNHTPTKYDVRIQGSPSKAIKINRMDINRTSSAILLWGTTGAYCFNVPKVLSPQFTTSISAYPVYESFFSSHTTAEILCVQWHPLSAAHVGILTTSYSKVDFWIFNLATDVSEPEQSYPLNDLLVDPKFKGDSITSFCFSSGSGWDMFTVYFQTNSGQLFKMCPIIPHNALLQVKTLQLLYDQADSPQQTQWLDSVLPNLQSQEDAYSRTKTPPLDFRCSLQGPLLPGSRTSPSNRSGWDGLYLFKYPGSGPVTLLQTRSLSAEIRCVLQIIPSYPQWSNSRTVVQIAPLLPFDLIDLELEPSKLPPKLILTCSPLHMCFFAHHSYGVHQITLSGLREIQEIYSTLSENLDHRDLNIPRANVVPFYINLSNEASVLGLVTSSDPCMGNHAVIILDSKFRHSVVKLNYFTSISTAFTLEEPSDTSAESQVNWIKQIPPPEPLPKFAAVGASDSEIILRLLEVQKHLQEQQINYIRTVQKLIEEHTASAVREKTKQEDDYDLLVKRFELIKQRNDDIQKKIDRFTLMHKALSERVAITQKLWNFSHSKLSESERKLCSEMHFAEQDTVLLQAGISQLQRNLKIESPLTPIPQMYEQATLTDSQSKIKKSLEEDKETLASLIDEVQQLEKKLQQELFT